MVHLHLVTATDEQKYLRLLLSSSCLVPAFLGSDVFCCVHHYKFGQTHCTICGRGAWQAWSWAPWVEQWGDSCVSHQKGVTHHLCCAPSTSTNQPQHLGSLCAGWGGFVSWGSGFWQCLHASVPAAGPLGEGQHPEEGPAAQLHPGQLPGGGHGGFPR